MLYSSDRPISPLVCNFASFWLLPLTLVTISSTGTKVTAQIVPDSTLPQNSVVTPDSNTTEITGGTPQGSNLFHSFEQFSVLNGQSAFFDNATTIENIITRITGNNVSQIDGLVRANGTANLFLLNPNGIIFTENAALDLGGSFVGSTADSINFADDTKYSAIAPNPNSLLTVSIPVGLQYGEDAGDIVVEGAGNNLFIDPDTYFTDKSDRPVGLEVSSNKTLALIGGNIELAGGNLTASEGRIELGSVTGGEVGLASDESGWMLNYAAVDGFKDISLYDRASVDASGNGGGNISVNGSIVGVYDGSAIFADTLGDAPGGGVNIFAESALEVIGSSPEQLFISRISSDVTLGATGDGGNITIDTGYLLLDFGGQIGASTFDLGNTGNVTVNASEIEIYEGYADGEIPLSSGIFNQSDFGDTGNAGDIEINADYLGLFGGGQISTSTFGTGNAGNLILNIAEIELIAGAAAFGPSGLFSDTEDLGDAGDINIAADYLLVADGAQISSGTFWDGNAGDINISASDIEVVGTSPRGNGGILSVANPDSTGNGGNIQVDAANLLVADGSQIAVATAGVGNAGVLDINADNIELTGSNAAFAAEIGSDQIASSGLFSSAIIDSGNSGTINLNSDRLSISDGAIISASNFSSRNADTPPGTGAAGDININVDVLELDTFDSADVSSITASAFAQPGGNIDINASSNIVLNNSSQIAAETKGEGNGGNINIATNIFELNSGGQVSVNSTQSGQAGNIAIASDTLNLNSAKITAASAQAGGGDITLNTNSINLIDGSAIDTSVSDSTGGGGNILINNQDFIIGRNNNRIQADAVEGSGGNIQINAKGIFFDATSTITASSQFGVDGIVEINNTESDKKIGTAELPDRIKRPNAVISSNCPISKENIFLISGKGGLPEDPQQYLRGQAIWQDLRIFQDKDKYLGSSELKQSLDSRQHLIEARNWQINRQGKVELVATQNNYAELGFGNNYSCQ